MKTIIAALFLVQSFFKTAIAINDQAAGDRTITRVVKMLQEMLDKSKSDGDDMRKLYADYKCYCDDNEALKKESIETLGRQIGLLESGIEELQGKNGVLSSEVANLKAEMAENEQQRSEAESVRAEEAKTYNAFKVDSEAAIGQMKEAIDTLAEIGADQTVSEGAADHKQLMSDFGADGTSLLKLKGNVKQALLAASAFTSKKKVRVVESFLQAPFTGTYTAQSGEVVGILKDMRDTFEANLESATKAEDAAITAFDKYMTTMAEAFETMSTSYDEKQGKLGDNDAALSTKRTSKTAAETQKAEDEDFLSKLLDMCSEKAKDYEKRVELRRDEETALAEAIAILNSDAAFATFGEVTATKSGPTATAFLQKMSIRRHLQHSRDTDITTRQKAQKMLRQAKRSHNLGFSKIIALLTTGNPFKIVIKEIKKVIKSIDAEEDADQEQLEWCNSERQTTDKSIEEKSGSIETLEGEIDELENTIDNPADGLKVTISNKNDDLTENGKTQAETTKTRKAENVEYQKDIKNLVQAAGLLEKAISVLTKYYDKITAAAGGSFVQDDPAPPATWEGSYAGQSGKGNDAISMLKYILENTQKEETTAHDTEQAAQETYEGAMATLKEDEAAMKESIATLTKELAEAEEELTGKKTLLEETTKEKEALEAYMEKIAPGCDFITKNYDTRKTNRENEKKALEDATALLEKTPAYQAAEAAAHDESLGDCKAICKDKGEDDVECKACLAKVTVPAYCAGHKGTSGC